jgi:hypothetical protein
LEIRNCDALVYWPEDVFQRLVSLKHFCVFGCSNLVGRAAVKGEPTPTMTRVLPHLNSFHVICCEKLTELFVLPQSITDIKIMFCESFKLAWDEDAESKSVHVEQLDTSFVAGR